MKLIRAGFNFISERKNKEREIFFTVWKKIHILTMNLPAAPVTGSPLRYDKLQGMIKFKAWFH